MTTMNGMKNGLNGVARLTHLGVIRAMGDDAAKFLHGQLTHDFALLGLEQARLAGYCNPKGRLLASVIGFKRSPTEIWLVCPTDILTPTLQRLMRYVLRAKVTLADASAELVVYGLAGDGLRRVLSDTLPNNAKDARLPWSRADVGRATVVQLYPADGVARALWVAPASEAAPPGQALSTALWAYGDVRSGIVTITPAVTEQFVPQMINFDVVGGVSFKKGCYPGQEVVARSQFRGTGIPKRRAFLAHSTVPLTAGDILFAADDSTGDVTSDAVAPCGLVAQAAAVPASASTSTAATEGFAAIVSLHTVAFEAGYVHAHQAFGPKVTLTAAPYPVVADV